MSLAGVGRIFYASVLLVSPSTFAHAQQAISPSVEPAWSVEEVVVRAPAPRLWKLTRGGSTVYVLGVVEPLPKGLAWNRVQIARILQGANRLIEAPQATVGLFGAAQAFRQSHLPHGRTLNDELPDSLRSRLHAVLARLGRNPDSLNGYKASWAALDLLRNLRDFGSVTDTEPRSTLRKLARDKRVPIKDSGHYDGTPALTQFANLPEGQGQVVLEKAIVAVDYQLDHATAIGRAWASGNLKVLRESEGPSASLSSLLRETANGQALSARSEEDIVAAVDEALALPGSSVTVFDIDRFARRGGAIDKLRAQGVQVTEPAD